MDQWEDEGIHAKNLQTVLGSNHRPTACCFCNFVLITQLTARASPTDLGRSKEKNALMYKNTAQTSAATKAPLHIPRRRHLTQHWVYTLTSYVPPDYKLHPGLGLSAQHRTGVQKVFPPKRSK